MKTHSAKAFGSLLFTLLCLLLAGHLFAGPALKKFTAKPAPDKSAACRQPVTLPAIPKKPSGQAQAADSGIWPGCVGPAAFILRGLKGSSNRKQ